MKRHLILKHQSPAGKMDDYDREALTEHLNEQYVNGANTMLTISIPLLVELGGDYKKAHIISIIRDQMLYNAERGKGVYRGAVWCKIGTRSMHLLTKRTMCERTLHTLIAELDEAGYIRRRVLYDPDECKYEETMYTLTDRAMILTGTNLRLAEVAEKVDSHDFPGQKITKAEREAVQEEETKTERTAEAKPSETTKRAEEKTEKRPSRKPSEKVSAANIEHGQVLIQNVLFPWSPGEYKYLAADLEGDDRRDADAAMMFELRKRGIDNFKKYIK